MTKWMYTRMDTRNYQAQGLQSLGEWPARAASWTQGPQPDLLLPAQALTVQKERDTLGKSQGCHEPVDLEHVVPGRGSGTEGGVGTSVGDRDGRQW